MSGAEDAVSPIARTNWRAFRGSTKILLGAGVCVAVLGAIFFPEYLGMVSQKRESAPVQQPESAPIKPFTPPPAAPATTTMASPQSEAQVLAGQDAKLRRLPPPIQMGTYIRRSPPAAQPVAQPAYAPAQAGVQTPYPPAVAYPPGAQSPAVAGVDGPGSLSEQVSGATTLPVSKAMVGQHRGFMISAGTKIPCLPVEAADSGLGGFYSCRVPEAVRDDTQSYRLLAPGTLIFGQVKKGLDHGQERLGILFTMIRTPEDLRIPLAAPAADAMGRAGLDGTVETFFWEKVGATATYALIDGVQNAITGGIQAGI